MRTRAHGFPCFEVVIDEPGRLVLRDVGPWTLHRTVTNGADEVVERLHEEGRLPPGRRLFYFDSEGFPGELLHAGGRFDAFAPAALDALR